ncbi:2-succinyl-5-enolpyruvyl-6-hydroxy-3-cyclohexene- 1-carboxylate synthase [Nocardioides baekrokdamisoli]|uniref:2-succinyl-5-enolpyruvyl-6-hydroxy-3-cyclohexene-1-carboxylate synthase n=1 Tax=Nocardioides baekrokdamisoli TaxID=1804624 RepID=A0A3G9IZL6_9ACTN|nr:2-succinyl-5-enolpyruvyl-6-hydroxy-3-cyclohexene-1-carboxylic-acid synthase [Nocardioides baekrokdamisoli]BBH17843.1 2-succinyl-5-enolpyruvyl-6-hydroxy-3-cyclohexene- 1-carboxylate synthase [Nocardioides baekrokdamisoli]
MSEARSGDAVSSDATVIARAVVSELIACGVREVVIAPGSRNAPLSFAVYDAAQAGLLRLHTRIDERSAGFLALGLTKAGSLAAVMCTSGTAVANLHPAVLEAAHAGVGLVVVTADRPAALRGTGANQTTDQVGIFGSAVSTVDLSTDDVPLLGSWVTHWNVQFTEPLTPGDRWTPAPVSSAETPLSSDLPNVRKAMAASSERSEDRPGTRLAQGPRTVVVAGDDAGPRARQIARAGGWPLLAEPSSGARCGDNAIRTYRLLLDGELGSQIERVIVAGHPTLSRPVAQLLARAEVYELPARGIWPTRPFEVSGVISEDVLVEEAGDAAWLEAWQAADRDLGRRVDAHLVEEGFTPHDVAAAVGNALKPGEQLIVGASNPIRDLDLMMRPYTVGERRKVLANRGLAGIDGVVSTAIGVALTRDTQAYALMGDVTFLHDSNGLILGPDEPRPDLAIVVVNDDGGSIFATLEQGAEAYADRFERLFATPHGVNIEALCAATRTPHLKVTSRLELEQALAHPNGGIEVIEARVGRRDRRALEATLRGLVSG